METILIVDDDKDLQFNLSVILRDEDYEVEACGNGKSAIKKVKMHTPNVVLLDIRLPEMDGMKVLEEMKKLDKDLIVIMLTAYGDVKNAVKAMRLGAFDYVTKPFDNEEIILIIKKALETQYLTREVENLRRKLGEKEAFKGVMGESPEIKKVLNQVNVIAPTNMTVILQGESGTGKELIAHMIHEKSKRKPAPFIAIDCGAIPDTLVESEFFGYEKGAFTGAEDTKVGKFEQANGGTLFLDEITNLSDATQMKFLRVIQERRLQRLGARKDVRIDVRIIVATNRSLFQVAREGKFRDDLFHRLNEFYIDLPPLRERKDDLPVLIKYFLDDANRELNKEIRCVSAEAMKLFFNYHWPGNVRELKNIIKKAVLLAESGEILPRNLPQEMTNPVLKSFLPNGSISQENNSPIRNTDTAFSLKDAVREVEVEAIQKALVKTGGNKIKAAKLLGMNRKALYRKMESLKLKL